MASDLISPKTLSSTVESRCEELAAKAKAIYPDPVPQKPPGPPWRWIAATTVLAGAATWLLMTALQPDRAQSVTLAAGMETLINGIPVKIVHQNTLPEKRLRWRMHQLYEDLKESEGASETAQVRKIFRSVLEKAMDEFGIEKKRVDPLGAIVERWEWKDGFDAQDASDRRCDQLQSLDREWCDELLKAFGGIEGAPADVMNHAKEQIDLFDETDYAVARTPADDETARFEVLMKGLRWPGRDWEVSHIRAVTLRIPN